MSVAICETGKLPSSIFWKIGQRVLFFYKMSLNILVASGVTSSLFAAILTTVSNKQTRFNFFAPLRDESNPVKLEALQKLGIVFLNKDALQQIKFDRTLWLSTHTDVEYLAKQAKLMPTLAINSAAILDILHGKQAEADANAYQKDKLNLYRISLLYNFIPGFFIQDVERQPWQSKGLHGETTERLFATKFIDNQDGWWQKTYCVTPLSYIATSLINWLSVPHTFDKTTVLCSQRPYRRFDLRHFAGLSTIEELEQQPRLPILYKDAQMDDAFVCKACKQAAGR